MIETHEPPHDVANGVDPGSPSDDTNDLIVAFGDDGVIGYVSPAMERLLGWRPEDIVGRPVSSFVHPDDVTRGVAHVACSRDRTDSPGSAVFRVLRADGTWVPIAMWAGRGALGGERGLFIAVCRLAVAQGEESDLLVRLLEGDRLHLVVQRVLDRLFWSVRGSQIAIAWPDEGGRQHLSTGLPPALCGLDDTGPWADAQVSARSVMRGDLSGLDETTRTLAAAHGRGGYWIEPVPSPGGEAATITLWTEPGVDPRHHQYAMRRTRHALEVALQFAAQWRTLDHAASHDPLTGLPNRKALLDAMGRRDRGALLYCDLDRFKPVNDELGHAAGDELLALVAQRLRSCVRAGDVVARIGGDEFIVLCHAIDREETEVITTRILDAVHRPFALGHRTVDIGVSIGVAFETHQVDDASLIAADHALYAAKSAGRGLVRWANEL